MCWIKSILLLSTFTCNMFRGCNVVNLNMFDKNVPAMAFVTYMMPFWIHFGLIIKSYDITFSSSKSCAWNTILRYSNNYSVLINLLMTIISHLYPSIKYICTCLTISFFDRWWKVKVLHEILGEKKFNFSSWKFVAGIFC